MTSNAHQYLDAVTDAGASARSKMKYLILGGGSVVSEYYLPALRRTGNLGDVTVVDLDARSIELRHPEFSEAEFRDEEYASALGTATRPRADGATCIIVALPNQLHVDAVRSALEHGHVLCEKPLALTARECTQLRALSVAKGRLLKVAMSRRYLPSLMLARDIVEAKELGEVRSIEVHDCMPFLWRPRSFAFFSPKAGGVLADMGVHYLDYLDTLVGALHPVAYSDDARGGTESSLQYRLVAGDVGIEMRLSRVQQSGAYIKIRCRRGEITIDKTKENELVVTPYGHLSRRLVADSPFDDATWPRDFHGSFTQMLADFERAADGSSTRLADVADAERTAALIEWAYERRERQTPGRSARSAQIADRRKVLVTGATGFIGGHLVARLSCEFDGIRVAARTPGTCANAARFPVELVPTDLLDPASVRAAVADARTVYHLAYGTGGKDRARITIEGTRNVVEAAIAAGADCVVVLSTMYVFGFPEGTAVNESFPYRPYGGEYGRSKATMERWCLARAQSSLRTRIVVLNPTCVYGPGGGAYSGLPLDLARQGEFCWIEGGTGWCNYTYVENLIDAIVAAAQVPAAHGNRFIINDGTVSWRAFLEPMILPFTDEVFSSFTAAELAKLPRHGPSFRPSALFAAALSAPDVRAVAKRSKTIRRLFSLARVINPPNVCAATSSPPRPTHVDAEAGFPPEWLATLYNPAKVSFSAKKANDVLRWRPAIGLTDGLHKTIDWLTESRGAASVGRHEREPLFGLSSE